MKKLFALAAICAIIASSVSAQTSVSRVYIQGGQDARTNYLKEVYLNPSFNDGIVEYKNGKRYKSKLNYNRAVGNIQFISETGDTLALADETSINTVSIGSQLFYMNPACIQKLKGSDKLFLGKNERIKVADKQKVGAFGIPNAAGTIDSQDKLYSRNNNTIDINEQLLIRKTSVFYMKKADNEFTPASKKNVLSMFPGSEAAIKKFIDEKAIDFNSEADLIQLTEYLQSL